MNGTTRVYVREYLKRFANNPVEWAEKVLGVFLWSKQKEILESVFQNRRTAVRSGNAIGKTFDAALCTLAFLHLRRPSKVITTAPTWYQVKNLLWSEINHLFKTKLQPKEHPGTILQTRLQVRDDWFAVGISPRETVNFQGFHQKHILVILDEAPGVRNDIVDGAETLMTSENAHMLKIGNPIGMNDHFYASFQSPEYHKIHVSCFDSPNFTDEQVPLELQQKLVSKRWVEEKGREWGEDSILYQSRILGNFPEESSSKLIPLQWINDAINREKEPGSKSMGLDVARFGESRTVFALVEGNALVKLDISKNRDLMTTAGEGIRLIQEFQPMHFSIDDTGLGGGVTDRVREVIDERLNEGENEDIWTNVSVFPVNSSSAPVEKGKFNNRRSELWWNLREWVRDVGCIPNDERLILELNAPNFSVDSSGRIKVESKEDIIKRLKYSPDLADGLALALVRKGSNIKGTFVQVDFMPKADYYSASRRRQGILGRM